MKIFLSILTGFFLTLGAYAGGLLTAIFLVDADPVPTSSPGLESAVLWTDDTGAADDAVGPVREDVAHFRLIYPASARPNPVRTASADGSIDALVTAATRTRDIADRDEDPMESAPPVNDAHVNWCSERYRSYRPETNSYTAYSGKVRECVSPYAGAAETASQDRPIVGFAVEDAEPAEPSARPTREHIRACFARYRSYRVEDNSYQPYGGGPRRQCR